jgi:hypothetical protein
LPFAASKNGLWFYLEIQLTMGATDNVYDLNYCVNSTLADIDKTEGKAYIRHLKWGNDAFRRLNLADGLPTMATVTLPVDQATNTVTLPNNFIEYSKIGLCVNGVLVNFDMNDSLCLDSAEPGSVCACTEEEITTGIEACCNGDGGYDTWYYPYFSQYHNGQFVAGIYGVGAGFKHGGFKINLEANKIQFDSCVTADEIVLEYRSSGLSSNGNAIVQQTAIPAITAYIHWRRCKFSKDSTDKRDEEGHRREWVSESAAMFKRKNALTYNEWLSLFRKLTFQTPKR